jgi:PAS domain S-box-containing protein
MVSENDDPSEGQAKPFEPGSPGQLLRFLAAVVDSTDDAVIGKTLDGTILSWNGGAEKLYGYTAEEAVGQHVSILVPPEHREELEGILDRLRSGQRVPSFETVRVRKDGTLVDVSVTMSPVRDDDGVLVGASAIARDVTHVHQALTTVQRQATQLHDEVLQGVATAKLALELGDNDLLTTTLSSTLEIVRAMVSQLVSTEPVPGELRRRFS